jgi:hypothetical protein
MPPFLRDVLGREWEKYYGMEAQLWNVGDITSKKQTK